MSAAHPSMERLTRRFYSTGSVSLAQALIGRTLVRVLDDGTRLAGTIVETEAYLGVEDRAAHAFGGRRTPRNESMYGPPGTAYVYFTYGMHFCFNVVCGGEGEPVAVLIRALEPIEGLGLMRAHRAARLGRARRPRELRDSDLCSGPGKLCQAMAVDRKLDRVDLTDSSLIWLERGVSKGFPPEPLGNSPRIGVGYSGVWAARPLRWFVRGNPHVSGPKGGRVA